MTEPSQRLPGLRAAGLVVSLAVVLAGGAAAASYAALRGDARSTANVPSETTGTPVAQAPVTTAPVTPTTTAPAPTASVPDTTSSSDTSDLDTSAAADDTAADTSSGLDTSGTGAATSNPAPSTGANTNSAADAAAAAAAAKAAADAAAKKAAEDKAAKEKADKKPPVTGPVTFAAGMGTIYDPEGVVEDQGEQANAIDGSTGKSWKVKLVPEQTGGFGYVLDFDPATKLKTVNVVSGTKGAKVKVLGTTRSTLPRDVIDNGWDTLADETKLQEGDNVLSLQAASGATSRYKHVLVLVTDAPGTPAALTIREIKATR